MSKTNTKPAETSSDVTPVETAGFDLNRLRLPQDFGATTGVKKLLTTVPIRKPHRQEFIRVHPNKEWHLQTAILEVKEDREHYLVDASLWSELMGEVVPKILFTAINRQGVLFLWPIRMPGSDGRLDAWSQSALDAAHHAMDKWTRMSANMALGAYEVWQASSLLDEPTWPDITFSEVMQIAAKDRWVKSLDHPALRRLRGEL